MIYERRIIRVKIIGEPGLHTNKEASVKPIFKSYKLGQSILSLVLAGFFIVFFQGFQRKNSRCVFPLGGSKKIK